MLKQLIVVILIVSAPVLSVSHAATVAYFDEASFQGDLDAFTLINLDAAPFDGFGDPYSVQGAGPAAAFLAAGISFDANHQVQAGNAIQLVKPGRDRILTNGSGFGIGDMIVNLSYPVNGFGAWTNSHPTFGADGGEIVVYDITGLELGRVAFGQTPADSGGFSGLITDQAIASAEITCTFNSDLKCGVYDIQFGTVAPVPVPPAVLLFASAICGLVGFGRRMRDDRDSAINGI